MARGIPKAKADEVFDLMAKFADYGFNKSHAAAYALVSYQTAWMKANHPVAFLAACMDLAISNTDKLAALRQEAQRMGVARAAARHQPLGGAVPGRGAWTAAVASATRWRRSRRSGWQAMEALVRTRGDRPFADVADFAARIDPRQLNKMQIENLARAGAFDGLHANRAQVFAGAETDPAPRAGARRRRRRAGQAGLFGGGGSPTRCGCRTCPTGPGWSGSATRRRRSAST